MTNINTFQGDVFIHEYIKHSGDDNTYFGFSGNDTFTIATGGTGRLTINSAGNVTLGVDLYIPNNIHHSGDAGTYFGFSANDTFTISTASTVRFTVAADGNITVGAGLFIPNYVYHAGDTNTYFGFSAADTIVMRTAGADRLTIGSTGTVTLAGNLYIPTYVYHSGDNDTYFGFSGNDTIVMRTSGVDRLTINSSGVITIPGGLSTSVTPGTYLTGSAYNGSTARTFAVDATTAATASKIVARDVSGNITGNFILGTYVNMSHAASVRNSDTVFYSSTDAYIRKNTAAGMRSSLGCLASDGTAATATKVQVSRDDTGDTAMYLTMAPDSTAGQKDLYMDTNLIYDNTNNRLRLKQVMFGDQNVYGLGAVSGQYGTVETVGTGKGSYEGYSINGHWVFMSNGTALAGIFNDNTNKWATKYNESGSTDLYYNNYNKLQTTNTGANVTGTLSANSIVIPDYIVHNGDTNTYMGFSAADTIVMRTAGVNRITVNSAGNVTLGVNMVIPDYIYHGGGDNDTYMGFSGNDTIVMRTAGVNRLTVDVSGHVTCQNGLFVPNYIYHAGDDNTYFGFPSTDTIRFRTAGVDRMTVDDGGRIQMGTSSHSGTNGILIIYSGAGVTQDQFTFKAAVNTNIIGFFLNAAGGQRGSIGGQTNSVSYVTTSDVRLKKQIKPMGSTLDRVNTLKPSTYTWIRDEAKGFGFIAQEVFEVFPELKPVVPYSGCTCKCGAERCESCPLCEDEHDYPKDKDGNDFYYGLDYGLFTPYLTKAIQELDVKVEENHNRKSLVTDIEYSAVSDYEGLVVSASTNEYKNGRPVLKLSNTENDKKSYGVILGKAKSVDNETNVQKSGDGRLWVVNTAGKLESGDLVTTSNISGYGKKQDDDILRSYTLVKVTQDCDFTEQYTPVKRVKQEMKDVTYYLQENYVKVLDMKTVKEEDVIERELPMYVKSLEGREDFDTQIITPEISEEEYTALTEDEKKSYTISYKKYITPYEYNRITEAEKTFYQETTQTNNYTKELYESSKTMPACCGEYTTVVRQELVDVLDDNDQLVWEEINEMELVYKIRYLDASGAQTDEANTVHKAAFVGCTYHCG